MTILHRKKKRSLEDMDCEGSDGAYEHILASVFKEFYSLNVLTTL